MQYNVKVSFDGETFAVKAYQSYFEVKLLFPAAPLASYVVI